MVKKLEAIYKFLQTAKEFIKNNKRISKDDILRFAKQEFGEISDLLKLQIDRLFKTTKGTPSKSKSDVVPIKKQENLVRKPEEFATRKEYERYLDETLGPPDDVFGSPLKDDLLKEWDKVNAKNVTPDIKKVIDEKEGDDFIDFVRKSGDEEGANKIQKEVDRLNKAMEDANKRVEIAEGIKSTDEAKKLNLTELEAKLDEIGKERAIRIRKQNEEVERRTGKPFKQGPDLEEIDVDRLNFIPGGSRYAEGNIRTAVRQFMRSEEKAGRLKLNETDSFRIREYSPMNEDDPIDVFRRYYGEDALDAADAMADKLQYGESFKHYEEIFRKNMPDLKPKIKGAGEYDDSVKAGEELRKLSEFDPGDRKPNAHGGLIDILKL